MYFYDIIYDFFYTNIFSSNSILLQDWIFPLYSVEDSPIGITFQDYLSHFSTIVVIALLCIAVGLGVVWLFKTLVRIITQWAL